MTLNEHGAGCRCLLRACENEGRPGISDECFIHRFLPRYPWWQTQPGAADLGVLDEVAQDLGLAGGIEVFRDYDRLVQEHQAGRVILVSTERVPEPRESRPDARRFMMLTVAMDAEGFTLWCPYPSGQSENLPRASREWWDRWFAIGLVLQPLRAA